MKALLTFILVSSFLSLSAQFDTTIVYDSEGLPLYYKYQLIVQFDPEVVNTNLIDSVEFDTATVEDYLRPDILQYLIDSNDYDVDLATLRCTKIFKTLTTDITYSISRLGDTIPIPPDWATFLIEWPSDAGYTIEEVCDSLNKFKPLIKFAQPNFLYLSFSVPNDSHYAGFQKSLQFGGISFPNAGINAEPAWDIEVGQPHIKVGVFDQIVNWRHEDFGDGTTTGTKIKLGWDWTSNQSFFTGRIWGSHGTACAGIIGALRNNNKGIAGIAGGNVSLNNNTGADIYSFGILSHSNIFAPSNLIASAIMEGAAFNQSKNFGYGLHIQNHSWGSKPGAGHWDYLINNEVKFCYLSNCVFIAGRGNFGTEEETYPSCYKNEWVINVGASGTDGHRKFFIDQNNHNGISEFNTSFGQTIDLIAPGTMELVTTTTDDQHLFNLPGCVKPSGTDDYECFDGTSASAPHVSGVAALMLSQQNKTDRNHPANLSPDDVEFLLKKYTTDVTGSIFAYPSGYDKWNGWGLLNAGLVMQHLDWPKYQIFHSVDKAPDNTAFTLVNSNLTVNVSYDVNGVKKGEYIADLYTVTQSYTDVFPSGTQILNTWPRYSHKAGYDGVNDIEDYKSFTYSASISGSSVTHTISTKCWFLKSKIERFGVQVPINNWIPSLPWDVRPTYSMHVFNNTFTGIDEAIDEKTFKLKVYPNPSSSSINISFYTEKQNEMNFEVIDMTGRVVKTIAKLTNAGSNLETIDISDLSNGVYSIRLTSAEGTASQKIIKTE
ncbi:MAG TPA: S8 family peptidase [Bacteroidia bacterium]|nr:S8 family peptidase [Bacteroidia bacterium]